MKRIVLAVALLLGPACAEEDPALANDENVVNVDVSSNRFTPASVKIKVGQTVRWTWKGGQHNVVSGTCDESGGTPDGRFRSGPPVLGGGLDQAFPTAGTFPYYCEPHCTSGMKGEIIVE